MADPTQAEIITQMQNVVDVLEENRLYAEANTPNFVGLTDTLAQSMEGDFAADILGGSDALRANLNAMLTGGRALFDPLLRTWGKFINAPEEDPEAILSRLYTFFIDNSITVQTVVKVFGAAVAGGGNVGDATIHRITVDAEGEDLENATAEVKNAECVTDQNTGAEKNRAVYNIFGQSAGKDSLEELGSGLSANIQEANVDDSLLSNSGFDELSGADNANPDAIPGWESLTTADADLPVNGTNYELEETVIYHPAPDDNTPVRSLLVKAADVRLRQKFVNQKIPIDRLRPHIGFLAWNRDGGAWTGTITLRIGNKSVSVVAAAQAGWQVLLFLPGANNWVDNFTEDDASVRVDLVRTGGTDVNIDDVIFAPFETFDNSWFLIVGGRTPTLLQDTFAITDTETGAKIQRWLRRLYQAYLPADAVPTIADP